MPTLIHGHLLQALLELDLLLLEHEDPLLQIVVLNHEVRRGVILGNAVVSDRIAHSVDLRGPLPVISLDGRPDKNVLEVLQLVLQLGIFKHNIFEVALSEILDHPDLVVLLPEPLELKLVLLEQLLVGHVRLSLGLLLLLHWRLLRLARVVRLLELLLGARVLLHSSLLPVLGGLHWRLSRLI